MNTKVFPAALVCLFAVFAPVSPPEVRAGGKSKSKAAAKSKSKAQAQDPSTPEDEDQPRTGDKIPPGGYKPTNDIEELAWKHGTKAVNKELATLQARCGFTIPVEIEYAVPMEKWVAAEGWGLHRGCSDDARRGGCVNLSWCGSEVVAPLWSNGCGYEGEGPKTEYKGWNTKVKKLVCRGEAPPPGTSAMDLKHSKMKAVLSKDGTLTVTLHPSDANISNDLWEYLSPRLQANPSTEARDDGKHKPRAADKRQSSADDQAQPRAADKDQPKEADKTLPPGGYKPTNDIEEIAWKHGTKVLNEELGRMKERCGFTIPVELVYAVPMKEWVAAEGWGLRRGCSDEARSGGCVNLSWCGSEVVSQLWFSGCGGPGEGPKTEYKGWNAKVKKLVCRGEASPPDTSAIDREHSKMKAVLSKDGTLTVTMHPSDANISENFWEYLSPRIEAD